MRNPKVVGSQVENLNTALVSGLNALKLAGVTTTTTQYVVDSVIKQTGLGSIGLLVMLHLGIM